MPRFLALILLAPLLAGCPGPVRDDPPKPEIVRQYVPVPPELRKRCAWPRTHPNSKVFESNEARGKCLKVYEGQLDGIDKLGEQAPP